MAAAGESASSAYIPADNRLSPRPAWELDVTDKLTLATGEPYGSVISRESRSSRVHGGAFNWTLPLSLPANADAQWPVVLEADESRVITKLECDGSNLKWNSRDTGNLWHSGEGSAVVPLSSEQPACTLKLESLDIPLAYPNSFGRLRLRPATLNELVRFDRSHDQKQISIVNTGTIPLALEVRVLMEDYFGVPLNDQSMSFNLAAGERQSVDLSAHTPDKGLYKTRLWAENGSLKTYEYHLTENRFLISRERPDAVRLTDNWEKAFVPGPPDKNPPPTSGWIPGSTRLEDKDMTSHYMWARQTFTVPSDWPAGQSIELLLPNGIDSHAVVRLDGATIGEAANWELPKRFVLPSTLAPGSRHTLELGITDYIVGLRPGIPLPPPGPYQGANRAWIYTSSSTDPVRIGVSCVPELMSIPQTRSASIVIRPKVVGGKVLEVLASVESETPRSDLKVRMRVYDAGKMVFDIGEKTISIKPGQPQSVAMQKAWPEAQTWSLERPRLYELRTELLDAEGKVIDTRRDRFGFREFGIKGSYFTLNGEILKLHGGSHEYSTALLWPARPSPYRILRHGARKAGPTGAGMSQGVVSMDAADELGYLLKADTGGINAHGADNYDWQNPMMWSRLETTMIAVAKAYINHPSVIMWDAGNEISFKGPGEAYKMGELFRRIRTFDPTRLVTIGGSYPLVTGSEVVNYHGWGRWADRSDYYFWRPEERPRYLRDAGYFQHRPSAEPATNWVADLKTNSGPLLLYPGNTRELRHIDGRPVLFAEGMYMEGVDTYPLFGHNALLNLPMEEGRKDDATRPCWEALNMLGNRRLGIQNVRQAGSSSFMIHVSGGTGRYLLPLASFSWDRKYRFNSGSRMQTRFGVHYDLSEGAAVTATYRLLDGTAVLGEKSVDLNMKPGEIQFVDLDFALPPVASDKELRMEVRVWPRAGTGGFRDDVAITVLAPARLQLPASTVLAVFDPAKSVSPTLEAARVSFQNLQKISDWKQETVLLVGSEGLAGVAPQDLASLVPKIEAGGRIIVLDHFSLPQFLPRPLVQSKEAACYVARLDGPSVLTEGIVTEDLRAWTTKEKDQVTAWNSLEVPSGGMFRVHVTTVGKAPVLEVGQGLGRVLFVQLNMKDALGIEPVATRILGNILKWTGAPSPFQGQTTAIIPGDPKLTSGLQNRMGVVAPVLANADANLIIASGTSEETLAALESIRPRLLSGLERGGTLFLYGLDDAGAAWLSKLIGSPVEVRAFPHTHAFLTRVSPLTSGLGHADFWLSGLGRGFNIHKPREGENGNTGNTVVSGPRVQALTRPAYVAEIPVGQGRIVINLVRSLETPVPSQMRVLSTLLTNAGAKLDPDGAGQAATAWKFMTLDLTPFVNHSLVDTNDSTQPRGWNASGSDDDLRDFSTGKQTLRGVEYFITPAGTQKNHSVILIAGKSAKLGGLTEVKGIQVRAKADRLFFLHSAAWGVPGFTYRVYYTEDRKVWIPGKPDPFVDVVVKPNENITEWVHGGSVERSQKFLPGATVAWLGGNARTRGSSPTGDKDLGVFQMTWDNPHPEKEIESIDIISPGLAGSGNAFVFAITAATRDENPAKAESLPMPSLSDVLPEGTNEGDVQEQVQFPNYGFVLMRDGSISSIYDQQGKAFARSTPWQAVARGEEGGEKVTETLGSQTQGNVVSTSGGGGNRRVWEFTCNEEIDWKVTIIATPGRLRYELRYTPLADLKQGYTARLTTGLNFINGAEAKVKVNENPFAIKTASGEAIFAFDRRYTTWVFSYHLYPRFVSIFAPPKNGAPWTPKKEETLWWELTPP